MDYNISPGVERAYQNALAWASRRSPGAVRSPDSSDWLLGLLEEDEGRPYALLQRLSVNVPKLCHFLESELPFEVAIQNPSELYTQARGYSLQLRGEPTLTTDIVMFAVLVSDDTLAEQCANYGVDLARIERELRSEMIVAPESIQQPPGEFVVPQPTELAGAARVLDANLNRARESLRVIDDYTRFVLNDATLTEKCKSLRHQLAEATQRLPHGLLITSRDAASDVGTTIGTRSEYIRRTPHQVAEVNCKRLQESLRSAEEYGKLEGPEFARDIERIRYEAYILERAILIGAKSRERLPNDCLYVLLTGSQCVSGLDWTIAEAAAGGATIVQLREKTLSDRELLERAKQVRKWTRKANVTFIVNDRPDIARLSDADGVHLGQDDLAVQDARRILGPDAIIGVSTHNVQQVQQAVLDGANYLGIGPTFPSKTKAFAEFAGLDFIRRAVVETSLPAFALGGITLENVREVIAAGATRIAVSSAIAEAAEPQIVARQFRERLHRE